MAKLADILQQERERDTAEQWGIIHLYKTGSFYSAYEWSAWLIAVITFNDEVRMQTKDRKPIAVTRIIDSYLGILSHTASRCITQDLMSKPLAA